MKKNFHSFLFLFRLPFLIAIRLYQYLLSPDHSIWSKTIYPHGYCRFTPSCSDYGYQAIQKYGVVRGLPKTVWRIMRCNPWHKGGQDLP